MSKALWVSRESSDAGWTSGDEISITGSNTDSSAESVHQFTATEACTFSGMRGNIFSGGSGTNTFQFRVNTANGSQTASRSGTGAWEDSSNSDALAANDIFNIAYTDDGTDSKGWIAGNVQFASGHGNFHGGVGPGIIYDVDSGTTFNVLSGNLNSDGTSTEANVQWKNRAYTSWEALQVHISTNARTSTSTFKDRINTGDGGFQIDYAAGITGKVVDTTTATSLSAGDLLCTSTTLGAGTAEDLTISFIAGTFKSTSGKSEVWCGNQAGYSRTASATATYHMLGGGMAVTASTVTEANTRIKVGFAAKVSNLRCYVSANTYTGSSTIKLYQNGSAVITLTISAGATGWQENSSDTVTIDDNDELSYEIDEGTANSITIHSIGITFSPLGAKLVGGKLTNSILLGGLVR